MPKQSPTDDLLDAMLAGHRPDQEEMLRVKDFEEGQLFDVKSGEMKNPAAVLRECIAGFANAVGGVLVFGVKERPNDEPKDAPRSIDGFEAPGGDAEAWAGNVLANLPQLDPPRVAAVTVEGKVVLLIAVRRARSLVPVRVGQDLVYYARFGPGTIPLPPHAVSDLLLGRRAQAELQLKLARASVNLVPMSTVNPSVGAARIYLFFAVENGGLAHAPGVRIGFVAPTPEFDGAPLPPPPPRSLVEQVTMLEPTTMGGVPWHPIHSKTSHVPTGAFPINVGGFDRVEAGPLDRPWSLPLFPDRGRPARLIPELARVPQAVEEHMALEAECRGAVWAFAAAYAVAENAEPWWYQMSLRYNETLSRYDDSLLMKSINLEPVPSGTRPFVGLLFLPIDQEITGN